MLGKYDDTLDASVHVANVHVARPHVPRLACPAVRGRHRGGPGGSCTAGLPLVTTAVAHLPHAHSLFCCALAALVFIGIFIERLLFLIPVAHMNLVVVALALLALAGPLAWMLKQGADEAAGTAEPA